MESKIILVDDEVEFLRLQEEALNDAGLKSRSFTDPVAAWEFIESNRVNLVVTDWNMPVLSGMDLLFKIQGMQRPPYVIVATAYGTIDRAVQAMNEGAFHFLE